MKKVSLLLVLVFATMAVSAQDSGFSTKEGRNATFARNGFWDNWFVGVGAGANVYFGDHDSDAKFLSRPTVAPVLQVGKWYNPYIGGRLKFTGGSLHTFTKAATIMMHQKYVGGEADLMWNVSNYLGKYNENRFYSFIPYVGIGAATAWDYKVGGNKVKGKETQSTVSFNAGLINNFRLSNKLALAIELSGSMLKDDFDKETTNKSSYDGLGNVSASLVYKLGSKTDFSEALLMDQGLIDDLNSQINRLRQENSKLVQPKPCPKCPEAQTIVKEVAGTSLVTKNIVFFRLGSANVDKHQEINIFNTAKFLQDNPSAKVTVTGYADKKTGTPSINDRISEKRAKNVANTLIKKYNIDSNRVKVEWKGDTVQPYAENAWNRVAIVITE